MFLNDKTHLDLHGWAYDRFTDILEYRAKMDTRLGYR
ncbi:MAG: hypothetical protein J07HQW1_03335 [Haloquadratum walsbyi J07HQW1]|uniref:Uncharacterized protein n=1 Tax=Haloquadratum walsbyi J07HQW1 TaxID=1238424 RepID=U1MST3_9EURY|nr:MAG: hypothetical protein J07HQW1_03335 [Haloquadratum walsbyi J07HQW1]